MQVRLPRTASRWMCSLLPPNGPGLPRFPDRWLGKHGGRDPGVEPLYHPGSMQSYAKCNLLPLGINVLHLLGFSGVLQLQTGHCVHRLPDMTYELVLAVVPPDVSDPVERAYELMDPLCHFEECNDDEPCPGGHFWDSASVGGHYHSGCLWRDRYGRALPDHPIKVPKDEIRRVGDVDLRFLYLSPTSLVTPDGDVYFMAGGPGRCDRTIAQFIAYEERFAAYPDHLAIPMACHS
jgi:hypothetical protein